MPLAAVVDKYPTHPRTQQCLDGFLAAAPSRQHEGSHSLCGLTGRLRAARQQLLHPRAVALCRRHQQLLLCRMLLIRILFRSRNLWLLLGACYALRRLPCRVGSVTCLIDMCCMQAARLCRCFNLPSLPASVICYSQVAMTMPLLHFGNTTGCWT